MKDSATSMIAAIANVGIWYLTSNDFNGYAALALICTSLICRTIEEKK